MDAWVFILINTVIRNASFPVLQTVDYATYKQVADFLNHSYVANYNNYIHYLLVNYMRDYLATHYSFCY